MRLLVLILLAYWPSGVVAADTVVAARSLRAGHVLGIRDVNLAQTSVAGAIIDLRAAVGKQLTRNVYQGKPLMPDDLRPPFVIDRNQLVSLHFAAGGLTIETAGRALDGGGVGETIRVMNESSRKTVLGRVRNDGIIVVQGGLQ